LSRKIKARYEKGILKLIEPVQLKDGEEVLVKIERLEDRKKIVEEFYGKRGQAPKELLDEFMLEARLTLEIRETNYEITSENMV